MRVLVLHPDENPKRAGHSRNWDMVVDLANGGPASHRQYSELFHCPFVSVPKAGPAEFRRVAAAFGFGQGRLVDDLGFDWWKLLSIRFYEQMLHLFTLERLFQTCPREAEFFTTRSSFQSQVLKLIRPGRVHDLPRPPGRFARGAHVTRRVLRLRPRQVLEILADKYDGDYRIRRSFVRSSRRLRGPLVLLPSAYENASRTAFAYARALPDVNFLLVATRQNARLKASPQNVAQSHLASYALPSGDNQELTRLLMAWECLLDEFWHHHELSILIKTGCFEIMPPLLKQGLAIRDSWLNVFDSEPVAAVLSSDEMNWLTRLPILIAQRRGLPALACHHGALDVRYSFQKTSADKFLVKGEMERDYLIEVCNCSPEQLEIAAPYSEVSVRNKRAQQSIVFFSEPYESFGGRGREFYREILPNLAQVAEEYGCELVLKLHPYESWRERSRLARSVLPVRQRKLLRVLDGPLRKELLRRTWFAMTISSSAALDSALEDVPVFLCEWLDISCAGYTGEFIKFGVARELPSANAILNVPQLLAAHQSVNTHELWQSVEPERLRHLLFGHTVMCTHDPELTSVECTCT
jgi:hypothetical protein